MTTRLTRRRTALFPTDLLNLPFLPFGGPSIRIEDYRDEDVYVIRAELPGIDPEKDVDLLVRDGMLRLRVTREEAERAERHTEFRYGSFYRAVPLPIGAQEEKVEAAYESGILAIRVPVAEPMNGGRHVPVENRGR